MKKAIVFLLLILLFSLTGISSAKEETLIVGAKDFTEQYVVGNLIKILLEEHGYQVNYHDGLAGPALRRFLEFGDIDIYMEYPGTTWYVYLTEAEILKPDEMYYRLKEEDLNRGIVWLDRTGFKNSYALVMRKEEAKKLNLETISDLSAHFATHPGNLTIAMHHDFYFRPDGFQRMEATYGFDFHKRDEKPVIKGLVHGLLNSREVDVAAVLLTDPQIQKYGFRVLKDDKGFFLQYSLAPVIQKSIADNHPHVVKLLNTLTTLIPDRETMIKLNLRVYTGEEDPKEIAREFLLKCGLIEK